MKISAESYRMSKSSTGYEKGNDFFRMSKIRGSRVKEVLRIVKQVLEIAEKLSVDGSWEQADMQEHILKILVKSKC